MKKGTGIILTVVILLFIAAGGIYIGIGMHYVDHFFEHTYINGLDVSDLTVEAAEEMIAGQVEDYQMTLLTKEGNQETIQGSAIGYQYVSGGETEEFLERQNFFAWLPALFRGDTEYTMETSFTYDRTLLEQAVDSLSCMQADQVTAPQDAYLARQEDGTYGIVPEVEGNQLNRDKVIETLEAAIDQNQETVNLSESGCYLTPSVHADDGALRAEAAVMNQYSNITVTYQMGGDVTVTLDKETTSSWLSLDENKQPVFDREAVAAWVNQLADTYDTIGTSQPFVTSNGETVYVEAVTYGWQMDRESETEALYQLLMAGESAERSPVYLEGAVTRGENDIGDTYVEIDYTNQRMWYYKDGSLLVETAVVTGNTSAGMGSPEGIFCIVGKEKNAILTGEDYKTPVDYWMPFYGGVGIHDADSWRSVYGGTIYQYGGSHGCINTPSAQAAVIYENIDVGTPVVCYSSGINYGYGEYSVSGGSTQIQTEGQAQSETQAQSQALQTEAGQTEASSGTQNQENQGDIVILEGGESGTGSLASGGETSQSGSGSSAVGEEGQIYIIE